MYTGFAEVYDQLMNDVNYADWAEFYVQIMNAFGIRGGKICECACGTGGLTLPLYRKGFHVTGVDLSQDMLWIAAQKARQAGVTILRTDELGTIQAVSDGKEVTFTWQNQSAAPENVEAAPQVFIGNKNSRKFHAPTCDSLPGEKNRVEFETYKEAVEAGYTPCSGCIG